VVLIFFAFSTSQEYYTMPAYFPLLLLLANDLAEAEQTSNRQWLTTTAALLTAIAVMAGGVLTAGLWASRNLPYVPDISTVLAKHNLSTDTLSMSHALDLTADSFAALRLPAILAAAAFLLGPPTSLWLRLRRKNVTATISIVLTMTVFFVAAHLALNRFASYLSSKNLAEQVAHLSRPGDRVMIYGDQAFGSSLLFYLQRPIELVNGRTTSMWFGSTYPDAPRIFLNDDELARAWNSEQRVFLFVPSYQRAQVDSLLARKFVVAESSGKAIYSNRL
jgi:hypothetical protein